MTIKDDLIALGLPCITANSTADITFTGPLTDDQLDILEDYLDQESISTRRAKKLRQAAKALLQPLAGINIADMTAAQRTTVTTALAIIAGIATPAGVITGKVKEIRKG